MHKSPRYEPKPRARSKNAMNRATSASLSISDWPSSLSASLPPIAEHSELQTICNAGTQRAQCDKQPSRRNSLRDESITLSETFYSLNQSCAQQSAGPSYLLRGSAEKNDKLEQYFDRLKQQQENSKPVAVNFILPRFNIDGALEALPIIIFSIFVVGLFISTWY